MATLSNKILFQNFNKEAIEEMRTQLDRNKITASGTTKRELTSEATNYRSTIEGVDYMRWQEDGRGATRNTGDGSLKEKILEWIDDKPIPLFRDRKGRFMEKKTMAFLIARKIHQEGTLLHRLGEHVDVFSNVLTEERVNDLIDQLGINFEAEVRSDLIKKLEAIKA